MLEHHIYMFIHNYYDNSWAYPMLEHQVYVTEGVISTTVCSYTWFPYRLVEWKYMCNVMYLLCLYVLVLQTFDDPISVAIVLALCKICLIWEWQLIKCIFYRQGHTPFVYFSSWYLHVHSTSVMIKDWEMSLLVVINVTIWPQWQVDMQKLETLKDVHPIPVMYLFGSEPNEDNSCQCWLILPPLALYIECPVSASPFFVYPTQWANLISSLGALFDVHCNRKLKLMYGCKSSSSTAFHLHTCTTLVWLLA